MRWHLRRVRNRVRAWWRIHVRPSPLQREFKRGDPQGIVSRHAEKIVRELERRPRDD
jgi:hypothetical protein